MHTHTYTHTCECICLPSRDQRGGHTCGRERNINTQCVQSYRYVHKYIPTQTTQNTHTNVVTTTVKTRERLCAADYTQDVHKMYTRGMLVGPPLVPHNCISVCVHQGKRGGEIIHQSQGDNHVPQENCACCCTGAGHYAHVVYHITMGICMCAYMVPTLVPASSFCLGCALLQHADGDKTC